MPTSNAAAESPSLQIENHGDALKMALEPVAPPTMDREGYVIESGGVSMKVLWVSDDGTSASGLWEAQPGVIKGVFLFDERDYILSGRMTVRPEEGNPVEIRAGEFVHFPKGSTATWEIHETLRKCFNIYNPEGLPL
jgi:uncharacterized cupin superfamily protein